jgi:hypothetical protein
MPEEMIGVRSGSLNSSTGVGTIEIIISDFSVADFKSERANKFLLLTTFESLESRFNSPIVDFPWFILFILFSFLSTPITLNLFSAKKIAGKMDSIKHLRIG